MDQNKFPLGLPPYAHLKNLDCEISHVCHTMDPILDSIFCIQETTLISNSLTQVLGCHIELYLYFFFPTFFSFSSNNFFQGGATYSDGLLGCPPFYRPRLGKLLNGNLPPLVFGPPPISNWGVVLQTHSPCGLSPSFKGKSGVRCNILCF